MPVIPDLELPAVTNGYPPRSVLMSPARRMSDGRRLGAVTGYGLLEPKYANSYPTRQNSRTTWGRSLNLATIHSAITSADNGWMEPLTDLSRECMRLDGHLSAIVQKRIQRLVALPWQVVAATGEGVDERQAKELADLVRSVLEGIPNFGDRLGEVNWAVWDGRSASELGWMLKPGLRDVRWALRDLYWIHPRRLSFGAERELRVIDGGESTSGFSSSIGFDLREIPGKFIGYTPRVWGDYPEREGLSPRCQYHSFFARFGTRERLVLLELFGRPWRIMKSMPDYAGARDDEAIEGAWEIIKNASGATAIRMPDGYELNLETPPVGAGQVHEQAIDHANKTLSKQVLGSTGTTEAVPTGLGSSIGDAHLSEEDLVIAADARRLSEFIEDAVCDPIVVLNAGPQALAAAPKFQIMVQAAADRAQEAARLKGSLEAGLVVSAEQAYEVTGWRQPKPDEPVLRMVQRQAALGAPQPAPAPEVIYPAGKAPTIGELAPTPEESVGPVQQELPLETPAPKQPLSPPEGAPPPAAPAVG